jgi:RNA polymerase sigma-70 factor (ECF subfamily)
LSDLKYTEELFLLQKLKEGDIHALEIIFNKHYSNLSRYLLLLFKNEILVDHIAQDIFVHLWENRETLEIKTSLESYIYTAGRFKALNQVRDAKIQNDIRQRISDQVHKPYYENAPIESEELETIINEAINALPDRCRKIFRLSREDEMSYKEIADYLNISINTVEGQMSIALKKLRKVLSPFYLQILLLP